MDLIFTNFFYVFLISIIFNLILIKFKFFNINNYNNQVQDLHMNNPSRLGGVVIFITFFCYDIFIIGNINTFFWCASIIFAMAVFEDLKISIKPVIRLCIILISCFILISSFSVLPKFDVGPINFLLNNIIFQKIFFTLALATLINGQNIIDGTNGLSSITGICIFISILFIGFKVNDFYIINTSILIIILLLGFFILNYPFGKLFLGDAGSYFIGILSGYSVIYLFANYQELPVLLAAIILFYPTTEVLFSYFRRILKKKSPFSPDDNHLHQKVFLLLSRKLKNKKYNNALVVPFLSIIWLSPLFLLTLSIFNTSNIWLALIIILQITIYLTFYFLLTKSKN